jgi:hypothetical protein
MAIKYRLSDKEKEKAEDILQQREEEKKQEKKINDTIKNISINQSVLPTAKSNSTNKNTEISSHRQSDTISLPTARLATKKETINSKTMSRQAIEARIEAANINKNIEKGGYNNVNEIISNTLNSFKGGVQKGSTGIANAVLVPIAGQLQHYSNIGKKMGLLDKNNENILDKAYNKILDSSDYITEKASYRDNVNANINNEGIRTAGNVASSIGNMLPSIVSNIAIPGSGLLVTGVSAGGNAAQETINEDRNNLIQSVATGIIKGGIEAGTEKITGGNIVSKGSLDGIVGKTIASKVKTNIGKKIANKSYQFAGEMLEEQISDNAGYIVDKLINNKDLPSLEEWWNNAGETNRMTFLTTLALNLMGLGGSSKITTEEVSPDIQQLVDETIKKAKNDPEIQTKIQSTINNVQNNTQNIQQNQVNSQRNLQEQQITQIENNVAQNQNMEQIDTEKVKPQLDNILNNKELPMQSYIYEKSTNEKINTLREDASKYFNNSEKAHNYMKMLEKIIEDKDINIRLDANLKTADGRVANGSYSNGSITINPNSTRTGEFIAVHELTHAIGTKEMLNMVENYRKSNVEFDNSVKKLLNNYNSTEITEEALSDISAQLFGTQEFINNVAESNPNIFKKIYNEIKYLWHQFKGYKNQDQFVNDLYYKWTQAYNSNNKLNTQNSYAIETNDKGYKYVRADRQVISGNNPEVWKKQAKNYIDEKIRNNKDVKVYAQDGTELTITRNTSGKATFRNEVRQADGTIRKLTDEEFASKLRAETHIDELGKISTHKNGPVADTKNHDFAKDGFTYRNAYFEDIDGQYYKITMSVGKNGDINTIYNVGKMQQAQKNRSNSTNRGFKDPNGNNTASSRISSINSITNSNEDVNTTTKYSIQESENNSGSFSMQDKRFDVTGNENLDNASTLFFRTREDGVYYVQAVNNSGKITYDGSFIDKHSLEKSLGTDIAEYIVNNSETTNNEIYLESSKVENKTDYMMTHRPSEEYGNGSNFERNMDGVFEHPEWYINMREDYNIESLNALKKVRKKPDAEIMIYRATPGNEINFGDWVTPSKKYAELHNNSQLDGKGNILKLKVKAKDILWGGDDINEFGYFPDNNKYSQNNKNWQSYLEDNYKSDGTKTNLQDIKLPTAPKQVAPSMANNKLETGEYTKKQNENAKMRKHYESIMKSQYTSDEAKSISKQLMKSDTYVPESNNKQLKTADERIRISGPDSELNSLTARAMTGGNIKSDDIAVGERLIQYYSKTGDKQKLQEAIQATAMAGTTAGQTVQAMSLLNHQTPEGQAIWLQRSVEKMNNDLRKSRGENAEQFKLTEDMIEKIVNSKDEKDLHNNLNKVYEELGQQVSKTTIQKIDAWRYFAMLANPRTHIRNIVGNVAMAGTQSVKNKIAGTIEGIVSKVNPEMERTHTIIPASEEVKKFAKSDIKNVADRLGLNENKYNPKSRLENSMRTFKSDTIENTVGKAFKFNDNLLEAEDGVGLKYGYTKALSEYMTANNLNPKTITDKQLAKARNYAVEQAKEATFHQESSLATLLNQFSNKNNISKFFMDSTLPFKKTPINVAKAGLEYSPVGLVKSAVYDTVKLRNGDITVNQYIDNVSKGLTGTGIALVGYALASAGILKASGSDDKDKEGYDEDRGNQTYSIKIGDNTYSLDWLAPTGIPLFIGAEVHEIMQASREEKTSSSDDDTKYSQAIKTATNILDAFTNAMNPMTEMSMLSGLTSSLKSYDGDSSKMLANMGTNAVKSYVNQFVPTALSQVAKTTDTYERSTTSTKIGTLPKAVDSTKNYIMSKIPGLRQLLPTKTDVWGNDIKQADNVLQRALENGVFPWTRKEVSTNAVDSEIIKLYDNTGESSVFPDTINKNLTIDKQKYLMTSDEYSKYKKQYGKDSYELLDNLVKSSNYKKMNDTQKKTAIEKVYSYTNEQIKVDYAKQNKLDYDESTLSVTVNQIKKNNGNISNYFEYLALTNDLNKNTEKMKALYRAKYDDNTKKEIYKNSVGKEDSIYSLIEKTNINITEYIGYKSQEFTSDKEDNGTITGSSISGSKKKKVYNYIENMNITYSQKLLLKGMQYSLTDSEKSKVDNYVRKLNISNSEKLNILGKIKGFTIYKDNTYSY